MHTNWFRSLGLLIITLVLSMHIRAQGTITFSGDSIIVQSCHNFPSPTGTIWTVNSGNNSVTLNWKLITAKFPASGTTALIIDPIQFIPNSTGGSSWVNAHDSTRILFHIWPDTMITGDTSVFQIVVFDPLDSLGTAKILTALVYCPLQTSIMKETRHSISVFPNPSRKSFIVESKFSPDDTFLEMYDTMGKMVRRTVMTGLKMEIQGTNLPDGIYLLNISYKGEVVYKFKLVLQE
jgi:hypothetical protein